MAVGEDLPSVWVRPVNPEEYPGFAERKVKPVTRGDLGHRYHTVSLRWFSFDRPPSDSPQGFRVSDIASTLDLWTRDYEFGSVIWPMWPFLFAENWRELIDEIARRGLYLFDVWNYCPSGPFDRYGTSEYRVPDEVHRYMLEKLGPLLLGYDNGEQDGRYIGLYAGTVCPAPITRRQGYEAFAQYFRQLGNDLQNYLIALNSLTFPHYFAHMGNHRLLGTESAQALPSVPMWYAFVRGAGKQYGVLWYGNASVFNRWGWKSLAHPDAEDALEGGYWTGPTVGASMSLLRRFWYILTMYGSTIMGYDMGLLGTRQEERVVHGVEKSLPVLTDLGREHLEGAKWAADHADRGELHTPVALLWDFYTGWAPPRHLYTGDTFLVWGNMPYEKGDHQIDLVFRELYPDYPDAGFCHSERGFLTTTPCGDSFDVLLSDASAEVIDRYGCVVLLGETRLEGDLLDKLRAYVARGGRLVASAAQLGPGAETLFGVRVGAPDEAYHAMVPGQHWPINEMRFHLRHLQCEPGCELLAHTRQGAPLAVRQGHGRGETLLFAADWFLTDQTLGLEKIRNDVDQPLLSPYALLEHVRAILLPYLRSYSLVTVEGPPVQYLVNVTSRTDRLVVTLCNNSPSPWEGVVRPKHGRVKSAVNWMTDRQVRGGRSVRVQVPPLDVVVVELLLDSPAFTAKGAQ